MLYSCHAREIHTHNDAKFDHTLHSPRSEHFGISEKVRRACAAQLKIKMAPDVDSLNVSVATAVLLHHLSTTIV